MDPHQSICSAFHVCFHCLLLVFLLTSLSVLIKPCIAEGSIRCIDKERIALLAIKKELTDPSGRLSSWESQDCCTWFGIKCNNQTGYIIKLNLRNPYQLINGGVGDQSAYEKSCLGGKISPFLLELEYLSYLDLSFNNFEGVEIPEFLGRLKNLRYLNLSFSSFAGMIPSQLGNLSSLETLDLYAHSYSISGTWELRSDSLLWLHSLSSLRCLNMGFVKLNNVGADWLHAVNKLPLLVELNLYFCELGVLPQSLAFINFTSISVLDFSENSFNSAMPPWLFNLTALTQLYLRWNFFSGSIPGELPNSLGVLKNLQILDFSSNSFWGSIPTSIGKLSSLKRLDLSYNYMNGTIPESFGTLSELVDVNLMMNSWQGILQEVHLMNLRRLQNIRLTIGNHNSLVFKVSNKWVPPFRLKSIQVENCLVGPSFPMWLRIQSELTSVTLRNVGISDIIPEGWFSNLSSQITYLILSNNQIKGELPTHLEFLNLNIIDLSSNHFEGSLPLWSTNATEVYLQNNLFSGSIPEDLGALMPRLQKLRLSSNHLNGRIPSSWCDLKGLQILSLRSNHLSGEFPNCWYHSFMLWAIDVSANSLTGKIPSTFGLLPSLSVLLLSNNYFSGEIPVSLQNCSGLTSIDIEGNKFSGTLPSWIGEKFSSLFMLRVGSNSFNGAITPLLCKPPHLHILDISDNLFSGVIPSCIGGMSALVYGNSSEVFEQLLMVVMKGSILEYNHIMASKNSIDLSGNNLSGGIPDEVTNLSALRILNLSRNQLSGKITNKIGNLGHLETLDFSHNHLSGLIPESLGSLTSLLKLNLSYNALEGKIPTALKRFNDSSTFYGNPSLCGFPLPTRCLGGH
ncbi:hypothetical protein K2173_020618 [Erythroxylum novogranatense]|uniref:Leucine-rich repeat-containing N-terminal plant-type domain-containing protein n=1 Tax=Erythroxylum novogranatense TaxID=1862640 RepID=A0AAV8TGV1_9ROSI|nr:hypothetical protein K2173_020618 [Erythroxylum novogranatense]